MYIKKQKKNAGPPPITGVILPSKWNEQGKPARIAIHTDDQKEYEIGFSGVGKELLDLMYKRVVIQGKLRQQLSGREMLSVLKYQLIEDLSEDSPSGMQKA